MGLFQKNEKNTCPLCGSKYSFANAKFTINSGENICTKCVIEMTGYLKEHQMTLKRKSFNEIEELYNLEKEEPVLPGDNFVVSKTIAEIIEIDQTQNKLRPTGEYFKNHIIPIDSITNFEIVQDGQTISSGKLGRAVVGGILFGGAGAVVGAVTGNKSKTQVTELRIKLMINDIDHPLFYIPVLKKTAYTDTYDYQSAIRAAEEVISVLNLLVSKSNKETELQTLSMADELRKYKELMEDDIISQEEFEFKKNQILSK